MRDRAPANGIRRHLEEMRRMSDEVLVCRLESLEPLPDADSGPAASHPATTPQYHLLAQR